MTPLLWCRRLLAARWKQNLAVFVTSSLSIALSLTVILLAQGLRGGITAASQPFPILAGTKGSPYQLVLNAIFLKDQPLPNFLLKDAASLIDDSRVAMAVPLGFGDSFQGCPIIGTDLSAFRFHGVEQKEPLLRIAQGRLFAGEGEAVIGSRAAELTGLTLGETFQSVHGMVRGGRQKAHDHRLTVAGILKRSGSAYDSAIFIRLPDLLEQHHLEEPQAGALIVIPRGYSQALQLLSEYRNHKELQLIFPSQTVIRLFSILGDAETLLTVLSRTILLLALFIAGGSLYAMTAGCARDQALMHALGAPVSMIRGLFLRLSLIVTCAAAVSGPAAGVAAFYGIRRAALAAAGIDMPLILSLQLALPSAALILTGLAASAAALRKAPSERDMGGLW